MLTLGFHEYDYALDTEAPPPLTDKSTEAEKLLHDKWVRCNRMSLMIIKNSINPIIRGSIADSKDAKSYLASVDF